MHERKMEWRTVQHNLPLAQTQRYVLFTSGSGICSHCFGLSSAPTYATRSQGSKSGLTMLGNKDQYWFIR